MHPRLRRDDELRRRPVERQAAIRRPSASSGRPRRTRPCPCPDPDRSTRFVARVACAPPCPPRRESRASPDRWRPSRGSSRSARRAADSRPPGARAATASDRSMPKRTRTAGRRLEQVRLVASRARAFAAAPDAAASRCRESRSRGRACRRSRSAQRHVAVVLDLDVAHRDRRHVEPQRLPVIAVVERDPHLRVGRRRRAAPAAADPRGSSWRRRRRRCRC